jgi:hypothetical protein
VPDDWVGATSIKRIQSRFQPVVQQVGQERFKVVAKDHNRLRDVVTREGTV